MATQRNPIHHQKNHLMRFVSFVPIPQKNFGGPGVRYNPHINADDGRRRQKNSRSIK